MATAHGGGARRPDPAQRDQRRERTTRLARAEQAEWSTESLPGAGVLGDQPCGRQYDDRERGPGRARRAAAAAGRRRRRAATAVPSPSTTGSRNGPVTGNSQLWVAARKVAPPSQPRTAPSHPVGAARSSSSRGTRPMTASGHQRTSGKAKGGQRTRHRGAGARDPAGAASTPSHGAGGPLRRQPRRPVVTQPAWLHSRVPPRSAAIRCTMGARPAWCSSASERKRALLTSSRRSCTGCTTGIRRMSSPIVVWGSGPTWSMGSCSYDGRTRRCS